MPTGLRTLTPFPSMGTRLGTFPRHWEHSEGMSLTPSQGVVMNMFDTCYTFDVENKIILSVCVWYNLQAGETAQKMTEREKTHTTQHTWHDCMYMCRMIKDKRGIWSHMQLPVQTCNHMFSTHAFSHTKHIMTSDQCISIDNFQLAPWFVNRENKQ